ncbi:MAG TPA: M67 family metallopeptidase [Anaerolineales bacterium]|nr:M67 family metallopeptidase [Anaerolineales bacterium]
MMEQHWRDIRGHASAQYPLEACGLLAGKNDQVEVVIKIRNQSQSPTRFVMDPYEQLNAFQWIESNGLELIGIFHSHPRGPEVVSVTDIAEAAYPVVHVIVSRTGRDWSMRAFWIENGRVDEVELTLAR